MGNRDEQVRQRCANIAGHLRENIVLDLQEMLHEHHSYVAAFRYALENINEPERKVVIRADKRPTGEHERRYNAPVTDEVAIILVNEEHERRDIVLQERSGQLHRIAETHRAYDALQYPLMFWKG